MAQKLRAERSAGRELAGGAVGRDANIPRYFTGQENYDTALAEILEWPRTTVGPFDRRTTFVFGVDPLA